MKKKRREYLPPKKKMALLAATNANGTANRGAKTTDEAIAKMLGF